EPPHLPDDADHGNTSRSGAETKPWWKFWERPLRGLSGSPEYRTLIPESGDRESGMRSFGLHVGHQSRLTVAGWALVLLSVASTPAVGLVGGAWLTAQVGPRLVHFCVTGAGLAVWVAGVIVCRRLRIPLIAYDVRKPSGESDLL